MEGRVLSLVRVCMQTYLRTDVGVLTRALLIRPCAGLTEMASSSPGQTSPQGCNLFFSHSYAQRYCFDLMIEEMEYDQQDFKYRQRLYISDKSSCEDNAEVSTLGCSWDYMLPISALTSRSAFPTPTHDMKLRVVQSREQNLLARGMLLGQWMCATHVPRWGLTRSSRTLNVVFTINPHQQQPQHSCFSSCCLWPCSSF